MMIRLSRHDALQFGLLVCGHCGWPPNNHFDFGKKTCAHDSNCPGYKESARVGTIVKQKRKK